MRALLVSPSAFPAKAGTQPRTHGLKTAPCRVFARRIAPKQSSGSSLQVSASPLGCFAALAMTRGMGQWMNTPHSQPSPPQGGKGLIGSSPLPVGEGWVRALFSSHPRVPREGGDPDPFNRTENGPLPRLCEAHRAEATQGIITSGPRQSPGLLRCARNDAGDGGVDEHPLPRLRRYFPQRGKIYRP